MPLGMPKAALWIVASHFKGFMLLKYFLMALMTGLCVLYAVWTMVSFVGCNAAHFIY